MKQVQQYILDDGETSTENRLQRRMTRELRLLGRIMTARKGVRADIPNGSLKTVQGPTLRLHRVAPLQRSEDSQITWRIKDESSTLCTCHE